MKHKNTIRFLICPDSYKESLSATRASEIIADEIARCFPENRIHTHLLPLADGGEGTAELLSHYLKTIPYTLPVTGPTGDKIKATVWYNAHTQIAVLDMASAAGLSLVPSSKRNPLYTTTYGVGELIKEAIQMGARKIYLGLGGSATADCGIGLARALGVHFYDESHNRINTAHGGIKLKDIHSISTSNTLTSIHNTEIICLSDVQTPLKDCMKIFAPQKGADDPQSLDLLQQGTQKFYTLAVQKGGPSDFPGAGAAGGLGYGCRFFLGASIQAGARIILNLLDYKSLAESCDCIITGEGSFDAQSFQGKTIGSLLAYLREHKIKVPVFILAGQIKDVPFIAQKQKHSQWEAYPLINESLPLEQQLALAEDNLRFRVANLMHFIQNNVE